MKKEGNILITLKNYDINDKCHEEIHIIRKLYSERHLLDTINSIIELNLLHCESTKLEVVSVSLPLSCPYSVENIEHELNTIVFNKDITVSVERRYNLHE